MQKIIIKIDGMMCGMCENHINDAIRNNCKVKKVSSSHKKGETVIVADEDISDTVLKSVIDQTGYEILSIERAPYEKRGLFAKQ